MNLCKSGLISTRTKSLREKFSRNRSYSELSFKDTNTTSSLVSTPTESCSGSLAAVSSPITLRKHPEHPSSAIEQQAYLVSEPYCSALDLTATQCRRGGRDVRFPWQHDVAVQCDIIPTPAPLLSNKKAKDSQSSSSKKKTSSSSTSSAASTLINAAAATLRMTGITDSGQSSNSRFWKSSLLLPNLNVSTHASEQNSNESSNSASNVHSLRRQKSNRWASASVVRRPVLKRAASFDSRSGYARLVQSTSSPNSPPDCFENESHTPVLPVVMSKSKDLCDDTSGGNNSNAFAATATTTTTNRRGPDGTSSHYSANVTSSSNNNNNNSDNVFFWNSSSPLSSNTTFKTTALLGASAAMTAAAPFNSSLMAPNSSSASTPPSKSQSGHHNVDQNHTTTIQRRKLSSESSLKEIRRRQFLHSRKQPSSAPDSFDDDILSSIEKNHNVSTSSGENELFNFNTMHRLLNISLSATNADSIVKPFLLELPGGDTSCHPNLPSPNMQSEIQEVNPVLRKLSVLSRAPHKALATRLSDSGADRKHKAYQDLDDDFMYDEEDETLSEEPPMAAMQRRRRRRALVPPKLITDGYESSIELDDQRQQSSHSKSGDTSKDRSPSPSLHGCEVNNNKSPSDHDSGKDTPPIATSGEQQMLTQNSKHITPNVAVVSVELPTDSEHEGKDDDEMMMMSRGECHDKKQRTLHSGGSSGSGSSSTNNSQLGSNLHHHHSSHSRRRSSVVVIPPMQICPGDLLVYSKVLSQRSNMINDGGTLSSALLQETEHSRKHKNTWSLLRLFDRSTNRNKTEQILCGLEEVLANLQPTTSVVGESLLRFRGISWNEFLAQQEERRNSAESSIASSLVTSASAAAAAAVSATVGIGCSRFFHGARFSSLQSNMLDSSSGSSAGGGGSTGGGGSNASAHVCKKISLPTGNISRMMQQNLERITEKSKSIDDDEQLKPQRLQRTESCGTVSDVDSIYENIESLTTNNNNNKQRNKELLMASAARSKDDACLAEEELFSGDRYESDSFCCSCLSISKDEQRRREAMWELFQSDLQFLTDHLLVLKNVFMEPLKKIQVEGFAMYAEPEVLFGNLDEMIMVTYLFCTQFMNTLVGQTSANQLSVTNILKKVYQQNNKTVAHLMQAYHRYTLNYINALNYLETLRRQLEFTEFEKWCNRDPRCKKLQLTDLLVSPVQHVMRVPLLLKEIENRTEIASERATIQAIIKEQEHSLRELDDKMCWLKNFERLLEIQRNIIWPSIFDIEPKVFVPEFLKSLLAKQPCESLIVSPRRQIVLEGPLMVLDSGKPVEMYVFLFDDLLLITRRKKGLGKKQSTLTERWVSNCSGRNSSFSSVVSGSGSAAPIGNAGSGAASTTNTGPSAVVNAASATATSGSLIGGDPIHGPMQSGGGSLFKYVVYKQPLSLDRFYIHDVMVSTESAANLRNCFVLVCLNRFQQVITLHTFQAASESAKNVWVSKTRDTCDRWKRTLQSNMFRNPQSVQNQKSSNQQSNKHRLNPKQATMGNKSSESRRSSPSQLEVHPNSSSSSSNNNPNKDQRHGSNSSVGSIGSSLRDNVSCSYVMDDSIMTTSTFT